MPVADRRIATRVTARALRPSRINSQYDVAPDGRVLINVTAGDSATTPMR